MSTLITPDVSRKNKWWISKERYYELKHFCLQYYDWKREYERVTSDILCPKLKRDVRTTTNDLIDPVGNKAVLLYSLKRRIEMVEASAYSSDDILGSYILRAVTEGLAFTNLKMKLDIPCERDMYYDRYRKFFWILDRKRD